MASASEDFTHDYSSVPMHAAPTSVVMYHVADPTPPQTWPDLLTALNSNVLSSGSISLDNSLMIGNLQSIETVGLLENPANPALARQQILRDQLAFIASTWAQNVYIYPASTTTQLITGGGGWNMWNKTMGAYSPSVSYNLVYNFITTRANPPSITSVPRLSSFEETDCCGCWPF